MENQSIHLKYYNNIKNVLNAMGIVSQIYKDHIWINWPKNSLKEFYKKLELLKSKYSIRTEEEDTEDVEEEDSEVVDSEEEEDLEEVVWTEMMRVWMLLLKVAGEE